MNCNDCGGFLPHGCECSPFGGRVSPVASRLAGQGEQPTPAEILVQACRPEDRAMLQTDAGAELVRCAASAMTSTQCPDCRGYGRESDGSGARSPYGPKCQKCGGTGRVSASPAQGEQPAPAADEREALRELIADFRLSNWTDDQGDGLPLVDRITTGGTIAEGVAQLEVLADEIACFYAERRASAPAPAGDAPQQWRERVAAAMDQAWDDWSSDEGCFPGDFTVHSGRRLSFVAGAWAWHVADLLAASPTVPGDAPKGEGAHAQLMKFYGVGSRDALVEAQAHHIERLQAKLPPTPNVFAPQRVREG